MDFCIFKSHYYYRINNISLKSALAFVLCYREARRIKFIYLASRAIFELT